MTVRETDQPLVFTRYNGPPLSVSRETIVDYAIDDEADEKSVRVL